MEAIIVISGHGEFSQGLNSLVTGVFGEVDNIYTVPYAYDMSSQAFIEQLESLLKGYSEQTQFIVFTDMKGGTPFNKALELKLQGYNLALLTGTNFNMIATAINAQDEVETIAELVELIVRQGRESISSFTVNDLQRSSEEIIEDAI